MNITIPQLITNDDSINKAFRIAISDIVANIAMHKDGLLNELSEVIYAGLGYDKPWTRDAAINVWNCCGILFPEASKNTLISVLKEDENGLRVGGEYWDAVIWVTGAWNYYLYTLDKEFLKLAYKVSVNTIKYFENTASTFIVMYTEEIDYILRKKMNFPDLIRKKIRHLDETGEILFQTDK